jgi:hypothetical protein
MALVVAPYTRIYLGLISLATVDLVALSSIFQSYFDQAIKGDQVLSIGLSTFDALGCISREFSADFWRRTRACSAAEKRLNTSNNFMRPHAQNLSQCLR